MQREHSRGQFCTRLSSHGLLLPPCGCTLIAPLSWLVVIWQRLFDITLSSLCRFFFFFSSRRRHTRSLCDWSSDVCSSDLACVLAEPALTNVGIVHPVPGYHQALRELTRKYGTLLIIDETHTICAGPGGYTRAENLDPDFLVIGKPIAGGLPAPTYGFTHKVSEPNF